MSLALLGLVAALVPGRLLWLHRLGAGAGQRPPSNPQWDQRRHRRPNMTHRKMLRSGSQHSFDDPAQLGCLPPILSQARVLLNGCGSLPARSAVISCDFFRESRRRRYHIPAITTFLTVLLRAGYSVGCVASLACGIAT